MRTGATEPPKGLATSRSGRPIEARPKGRRPTGPPSPTTAKSQPAHGVRSTRHAHHVAPLRPSRKAMLRQQRTAAQTFRKRAVSKRQVRIYKAGQSSRRLVSVFVIAAVLFLAVLARVTVLQTVQAGALRTAGKDQRTTEQRLKAHRGTIFDRDGADMALSVPARTITANPKLVLDAAGTVRTLTALLHLDAAKQQSLLESFTAKKNSFV